VQHRWGIAPSGMLEPRRAAPQGLSLKPADPCLAPAPPTCRLEILEHAAVSPESVPSFLEGCGRRDEHLPASRARLRWGSVRRCWQEPDARPRRRGALGPSQADSRKDAENCTRGPAGAESAALGRRGGNTRRKVGFSGTGAAGPGSRSRPS